MTEYERAAFRRLGWVFKGCVVWLGLATAGTLAGFETRMVTSAAVSLLQFTVILWAFACVVGARSRMTESKSLAEQAQERAELELVALFDECRTLRAERDRLATKRRVAPVRRAATRTPKKRTARPADEADRSSPR